MKEYDQCRELGCDSINRNYCAQDDYVNNNDEIMEMMACGAVDNNMYMVVNIGEMVNCEEQEVF